MRFNNKHVQQGFTIVEIMIALSIGLFLTVGVTQIFLSTTQNNRMQENLSRMQENARFAMGFLTEDIRQAGYWGGGCVSDVIGSSQNHIQASGAGVGFQVNMVGAIQGDESGALDSVILRGLFGDDGLSKPVDMPSSTSAVAKVEKPFGTATGEIMLITDCGRADLFQVTSVVDAGTKFNLLHQNPTNYPGGHFPTNTYNADQVRIFSINPDNVEREYEIIDEALTRKVGTGAISELVDNIEALQILYGEADAGDKSKPPTHFVAAGQVTNVDVTTGDFVDVTSVRVSIVAVSPDANLITGTPPYLLNGVTVTPPDDGRIRKVYTSTITVRNRVK